MSVQPSRGRLIVVSGPSGAGKSSLWQRLVRHPGVAFSVSATTRAPRPGEVDGRDYHFLAEDEFLRRVAAGDFLEHARVHDRRYGTLRSEVEQALRSGHDLVLEIDVQGAEQVRRSGLPQVSIFVQAPSLAELERRLRDRNSESEEQIRERLAIAREEMARAHDYDLVVINDDFDRMATEVERFLGLP
ncbi:MAG: guanylate kinase [Planctomycetota bacterium]|nr:MAG: guanylate kinase [Planctomycetota bacterium]